MRASYRVVTAVILALFTVGCDLPTAIGDANRIVIGVPDEHWDVLEPAIAEALEPRSFTVRDELIFDIAQVDPSTADWSDFQKLRQVLVIGEAADPWVVAALEKVDGGAPRAPAVVQANNVWARPQTVTIVLLAPGSPPSAAAEMMPQVGELYIQQLEEYARQRMYVSGVQTELADSLERIAGFSLRVPQVYQVTEPRVGTFVFRNDQPNPAQLIRQLVVTSRPNDEVEMTPEAAFAWRAEVASQTTTPPQVTDSLHLGTQLRVGDRPAVQAQGTWTNPPGEWPAAGPVLTRMVRCDDRTYLIDGWIYAPGRSKYELVVQIETLQNSFRCAGEA